MKEKKKEGREGRYSAGRTSIFCPFFFWAMDSVAPYGVDTVGHFHPEEKLPDSPARSYPDRGDCAWPSQAACYL